jgi:hypothetical protein
MIDYASVYSALYSRLATHADGALARALLGSFPSSFPPDPSFAAQKAVFPAEKLSAFAGSGVTLPWAVWRALPTAGASGDMRSIGGAWWLYTAPNAGSRPLHQLAAALETLYGYTSALAITGGRLGITFVGSIVPDATLGLNALEVRIGYLQRG